MSVYHIGRDKYIYSLPSLAKGASLPQSEDLRIAARGVGAEYANVSDIGDVVRCIAPPSPGAQTQQIDT